ncbi:GH25 family lysozyme [Butyrivibrio sp. AE2032]|uniref:GH25 family lysozyme n=1 Tax=Butyrivibrio sp. AE2032 TaxID=1458463 RepID=UPI0005574258|nr:GH25 family lysozyme [Butyrivibrio sp. AE2032]
MNRKLKTAIIVAGALTALLIITAYLLYNGVIHINHPEMKGLTVKGVDVSCYQGDIDWSLLASQDLDFAFIKATEGSSFEDPKFRQNWQEASETGIRTGAYHFFSFESGGDTQAQNFINAVTPVDNMLPPVIDVEYYGSFGSVETIDVEAVRKELRVMVDILTEEYGIKPVIYVSEETYNTIVKDAFTDCGLWYRSVYSDLPDDVDWVFWQYSNRHRLKGYDGKERFIDMNVFSGNEDEFAKYGKA